MLSPTISDVGDERRVSGETIASTHPPVLEANGEAKPSSASGGRRLELLVHNDSHKDMVLSIRRTRCFAAATTAEAATAERFNGINVVSAVIPRCRWGCQFRCILCSLGLLVAHRTYRRWPQNRKIECAQADKYSFVPSNLVFSELSRWRFQVGFSFHAIPSRVVPTFPSSTDLP